MLRSCKTLTEIERLWNSAEITAAMEQLATLPESESYHHKWITNTYKYYHKQLFAAAPRSSLKHITHNPTREQPQGKLF